MEDPSFWSDLLDTYQSSADIIKALWLLVPPAFLLGVIALLRPRRDKPRSDDGELIYSIRRNRDGVLTVRCHGAFTLLSPGEILVTRLPVIPPRNDVV
jgi:hypothetical protein